jgi:hypothetical protein
MEMIHWQMIGHYQIAIQGLFKYNLMQLEPQAQVFCQLHPLFTGTDPQEINHLHQEFLYVIQQDNVLQSIVIPLRLKLRREEMW